MGGVALNAAIGVVAGAIGGGAGGGTSTVVAKGGTSTILGFLVASGGQAGGRQVGNIIDSHATGREYKPDVLQIGIDAGTGAFTLGLGANVGAFRSTQEVEDSAARQIFGPGQQNLFSYEPLGIYDAPKVSAYYNLVGFMEVNSRVYGVGGEFFKALAGALA